ncbi:hypothetical protein TIFTF001_017257 [Ficus carica]|uniref:Uncharacterized protein n=1 Tax=Ficus carica TaxID=3494 RepID=A0AA88D834_FICCA|nr:hypothetical protein TIFTF001_017257 [Ficus carica]
MGGPLHLTDFDDGGNLSDFGDGGKKRKGKIGFQTQKYKEEHKRDRELQRRKNDREERSIMGGGRRKVKDKTKVGGQLRPSTIQYPTGRQATECKIVNALYRTVHFCS